MKTINYFISLAGLTGGLFAGGAALAADASAPATTGAPAAATDQTPQPPAPGDQTAQPAAATSTPTNPAPIAVAQTNAPATPAAAQPAATETTDESTNADFSPDQGLVFRFKQVPLETVLNYMSKAAGFVIHPEVSINGTVDAFSDQPLSKDEALALLEHVLADNGYAVTRDGRILTIISSVEAKRSDIPVIKFTSLADIPRNSEVATYIIPVRTLNPVALINNLRPLIGSDTDLQANESANSLLITDSQNNIRRIANIVMELDSVSSSINTIEVFPLKYADAKSLADLVKELFPSPATTGNGQAGGGFGGGARFGGRGGGGGGFGGGGFGGGGAGGGGFGGFGGLAAALGGGGGGGAPGSGTTPQSRVAATSDDHSNSLIVSAPEDLIPTIRELVEKLDQPIEDVTEVKMFHLKNADCTEMANMLTSIFPDPNSANDASTQRVQFGGARGGRGAAAGPFGALFGAAAASSSSPESQYMKKMANVLAVPDPRTQSLLVSASKELMPQIEDMITELDDIDSGSMHVHRIALQNADPQDVLQIIQDIYPAGANKGSSSTTQNNVLATRAQTVNQNMLSSGVSSGSTSSGSAGGRGGGATGF
jgi:type II secretory pathway component GspD/PulD (secretin)